MDCNEFLARYSEYDDSRVAAGEAERFRAHLERCAGCARYDRVLRKGRMVARQLRVDSSDDFVLRLDRRLWRDAQRVRSSGLRVPARITAALAALTVLLAASAAVGILEIGPGARDLAAGEGDADADGVPVVVAPPAAPIRTRLAVLPVLDAAEPRGWSVERVAPAPITAYSPLVVGPPAYRRVAGPSNPAHTFD